MRHACRNFIVLSVCGILLTAQGPATAGPRALRRPGTVTVLGQRTRADRDAALRNGQPRMLTPVEAGAVRGRSSALVAMSERLLASQIDLLEKSLRLLSTSDARYPDFLFRLAEHYRAMSLNDWLAAMALEERIAAVRAAAARRAPPPGPRARPDH